ncbi:MAG: hypothetical protein GIW95_07950 [Candidatus Eremiobacteraeota bacterium]|nr:hypothetical protein [Candidatus Eremiobacteraeota bacterium]
MRKITAAAVAVLACATGSYAPVLAGSTALKPAAVSAGAPESAYEPAAVFLRRSTLEADGPRKGTTHLALFVRYPDGRSWMLGAYPDGKYEELAQAAPAIMRCSAGKEPPLPRAHYVAVATGAQGGELAAYIVRYCSSYNTAAIPYDTSVPASGAADNAFVLDLLRRGGVTVKR